jgi:hypothetical protein
MKKMTIYIWFACWKHGWILLRLGVQVSIGYNIIENENGVTGYSKNPNMVIFGDRGIHMRLLGNRVI